MSAQVHLQDVMEEQDQGLAWMNEEGQETDDSEENITPSEQDPVLSPFEVAARGVSSAVSKATKIIMQSGELKICMEAKRSLLLPDGSVIAFWPKASVTRNGEMYLEIDENLEDVATEEVKLE